MCICMFDWGADTTPCLIGECRCLIKERPCLIGALNESRRVRSAYRREGVKLCQAYQATPGLLRPDQATSGVSARSEYVGPVGVLDVTLV